MSSNQRVHRARNILGDRPDPASGPSSPTADAQQLARETAKAFDEYLDMYKEAKLAKIDCPPKGHVPSDDEEKAIYEMPPEQRTFDELEWLARKNLAGRAIEPLGRSAWERACFMAIRSRLMAAWPPRNPGEMLLIDELAQYEILRRHWVSVLTRLSRDRYTITSMKTPAKEQDKQTLTLAQATFEASRMVERIQRLYQQTLRSLLRVRKDKSSFKWHAPAPIAVMIERQSERREEEPSCDSAI